MNATFARGTFYADGLRWIASLLTAAADRLDRLQRDATPPAPTRPSSLSDEAIHDLRNRLTNTW